jgi:cytochrome P450
MIFRGIEQFGKMAAVQWYFPRLLEIMKKIAPGRYIGVHMQAQKEYADKRIAKRLELKTGRPDFVEAMATAKPDDGRMLTRDEMASNGRVLVLGGSETTATALAAATYFLAKHPDVQRKLADEVRSIFTLESEIDMFSAHKLQYMLAVLDESMRLFPPVPSQLPRVCQAGGDIICGYQVPEGVSLWEDQKWCRGH